MFICFDTETDNLPEKVNKNLNFKNVKLQQLAFIVFNNKFEQLYSFSSYVNYTNDIDKETFKPNVINKITYEQLQSGKTLTDVLDIFYFYLKKCNMIIAHNILFDYNVILTEALNINNKQLARYMRNIYKFDTMKMGGSQGLNLVNRYMPKLEEIYQAVNIITKNNIKYNGGNHISSESANDSTNNNISSSTDSSLSNGSSDNVSISNDTNINNDNNQNELQNNNGHILSSSHEFNEILDNNKTKHEALDDTYHCLECFKYMYYNMDNNIFKFNLHKPNYKTYKQIVNTNIKLCIWCLKIFTTGSKCNDSIYYFSLYLIFRHYNNLTIGSFLRKSNIKLHHNI